MFSRTGKSSASKYRILEEKDIILQKRCKLRRPDRPNFHQNKMQVDEINTLALEEQANIEKVRKTQALRSRHLMRSLSGNFIFKAQSRNDYYEASRNKDLIPPPGWYNILYSRTEKHRPVPDFKIQSSHDDLFKHINSNFIPCSPDKPRVKVPTIIPYNKQPKRILRKYQYKEKSYDNDPAALRKKVVTVNMNKTLPRKQLFNSTDSSMIYEVNKEAVMQDLGKVLNFGLMSKRKELFLINKTPEPYDINYVSVFPHEKSVDMSKMPPLLADAEVQLPSFMQTIHNRTSILHSSMKSIKMNSTIT